MKREFGEYVLPDGWLAGGNSYERSDSTRLVGKKIEDYPTKDSVL